MPASIQPENPVVSSTVRFNINALLDLFDRNVEASPYTNAIKAMLGEELPFALLENYFKATEGYEVTRPPGRPHAGQHQGHRLDRWITTQKGRDPAICYQVEIKFWSIQGVQSGAIRQRREEKDDDYRRRVWNTYWKNGRFREESLDKVLDRMQPLDDGRVADRPLACLWSPAHPEGLADPFFEVKGVGRTPATPFESVWVFSASSYLRWLSAHEASRGHIELDLPELKRHRELLGGLFLQTANLPAPCVLESVSTTTERSCSRLNGCQPRQSRR